MNKPDWDAMSARGKDALVARKVMRWRKQDRYWYSRHTGKAISLQWKWCPTTARDALALVEEEIRRRGKIPEYIAVVMSGLLNGPLEGSDVSAEWSGPCSLLVGLWSNHEAARLVMAIRCIDPDLCCYCAVEACEGQE